MLTSELKGYIEDPAYYFRDGPQASWALDLLLMTQGWRRYDIPRLTQGKLSRPVIPLEATPAITGRVENVIGEKPVKNIDVEILSLKGGYYESSQTDKDGHFAFYGCEEPDSTWFLVQTKHKSEKQRLNLLVDLVAYPARTLLSPVADKKEEEKKEYREIFEKYVDKAERKYIDENGIRVVHISEVTITADRKKPANMSPLYFQADNSLTAEDLEKYPDTNILNLLGQVGVRVMYTGNLLMPYKVSIRGQGSPLFLVNNIPWEAVDVAVLPPSTIERVDVLKTIVNTSMFGSAGANGVIAIYLKSGKESKELSSFHIKTVLPLGYQEAATFYSPKYETAEARGNGKPDLRTTIHWQPVVQTDSTGVASFEFYTADVDASYTVVIEGLTDDGQIIRHEGGISRKDRQAASK